jgi:hypothetical protein
MAGSHLGIRHVDEIGVFNPQTVTAEPTEPSHPVIPGLPQPPKVVSPPIVVPPPTKIFSSHSGGHTVITNGPAAALSTRPIPIATEFGFSESGDDEFAA